jgi:Domain of unknown function (DUF4116)
MSEIRPRLIHITDCYGLSLEEAIRTKDNHFHKQGLSVQDMVLYFSQSDPTAGKSRTQWLIQTYISDERFKLEDSGRAHAALSAFERFKRKLPLEQREIHNLPTLSALETLVAPFIRAEEKARLERDLSSATGRELRRLEELKARDESIILQEGEDMATIAVPMTEFAAKWWGRGTRWCTAAEKDNAFFDYHKKAPLIVLVDTDGQKFQMYVTSDTIQFMDDHDDNVQTWKVRDRWHSMQPLLDWAIKHNGRALQYVPENHRTKESCRIAVTNYLHAITFVPNHLKSDELYHLAFTLHWEALLYIPIEQRTEELCRLAITNGGRNLTSVPKSLRTQELCRMALEQDGRAIIFVPEDLRNDDLYRMALKSNGLALFGLPKSLRTPEFCQIAVEQNGEALEYVPYQYHTLELYALAFQQSSRALMYMPEDDITLEMCQHAIDQYGELLEYVPNRFRTQNLCQRAVINNADALSYVPEEYQTQELLTIIHSQPPDWTPDILSELNMSEDNSYLIPKT